MEKSCNKRCFRGFSGHFEARVWFSKYKIQCSFFRADADLDEPLWQYPVKQHVLSTKWLRQEWLRPDRRFIKQTASSVYHVRYPSVDLFIILTSIPLSQVCKYTHAWLCAHMCVSACVDVMQQSNVPPRPVRLSTNVANVKVRNKCRARSWQHKNGTLKLTWEDV